MPPLKKHAKSRLSNLFSYKASGSQAREKAKSRTLQGSNEENKENKVINEKMPIPKVLMAGRQPGQARSTGDTEFYQRLS
ncbi:hypothetical protein H2248_006624 [Termitomyces sp. 'cryptogamus']|nr:hypothetical protein H2248_006624 [Termitomyces sp. 'cryptogamus']